MFFDFRSCTGGHVYVRVRMHRCALPAEKRRARADGLVAHRHGLDGDDARGSLAGVDLDEAVGCVLPQHRSVARPAVHDPCTTRHDRERHQGRLVLALAI